MTYATVCSGVEAHSMAVAPFGWKPLFFSEIEDFPSVVLAHRFPSVPNLGDMTKITYDPFKGVITNGEVEIKYEVGSLGCLSGGTPCQDVSVAGKRRGMSKDSGTRSSLAFHFARLVRELRPRWVVWENVPGVLSSNGGRDFALFAGEIAKCGYGIAYRTFDAQYVRTAHIQGGRVDGYPRAVAQRRRRVWLVGHLGADARVPVEILFEPRSLRGNQPPSRYTREELAALACGGVGADDSVVEGEERGGGFRRGVAVENNTLRIAETTRTLSGDHDSRVTDTGTTVVQSKTSNGDDVYPTLTSRDLVAQVCKEQENRGGYVVSKLSRKSPAGGVEVGDDPFASSFGTVLKECQSPSAQAGRVTCSSGDTHTHEDWRFVVGRIEGGKHIDGAEQLSAHAGQGQFRGYRPARDVSATVIADICKMVGTTQDNLLLVMKKSK